MKYFYIALLTTLIFTEIISGAGDKNKFDININHLGKAQNNQTVYSHDGIEFTGEKVEYTLLKNGYFTLGTSAGMDAGTLDNNCQLTFGHPYARTSLPIINIDNKWQKLEELYSESNQKLIKSKDTLTVTFYNSSAVDVEFKLFQDENVNTVKLVSKIKNNDAVQHSYALGYIVDPALGKWGDGNLFVNNSLIDKSTNYNRADFIPDNLDIRERNSDPKGIGMQIYYSKNDINQINISNWFNFSNDLNTSIVTAEQLYDLAARIESKSISLLPGETFSFQINISLLQPVFNNQVFMRWNVPQFITIEDGVPFPGSMNTQVELSNNSGSEIQGAYLSAEQQDAISFLTEDKTFVIPAASKSSQNVTVTASEILETQIIELKIKCMKGSEVLDEVKRYILVPAVSMSDTGLTVAIDSAAFDKHPNVNLTFHTKLNTTGQLIYNLKKNNIFLYENDSKVYNFTVKPDTSGNVSQLDLVFVLDVTGSMSDEIDGVKENIIEFADSLKGGGVNFRIGMVTFLDQIENVYPFTNDPVKFKEYVSQQYAHGGDDEPENSLDALTKAAQLDFRPSSNRLFIWITDATYHIQDGITNLNSQQVVNTLLAEGITVNCIGRAENQTQFYDPIVNSTGGSFYDILGNFRDILLKISRLQKTGKYQISYYSSNPLSSINNVKLEVHYAGLGGSDTYVLDKKSTTSLGKSLALTCYPNPFNPVTKIEVVKPVNAFGKVAIYNILGELIRTFDLSAAAGKVTIQWDATNGKGGYVSSGFYIVNVSLYDSPGEQLTNMSQKILYLK